jgi:hypothetical protein
LSAESNEFLTSLKGNSTSLQKPPFTGQFIRRINPRRPPSDGIGRMFPRWAPNRLDSAQDIYDACGRLVLRLGFLTGALRGARRNVLGNRPVGSRRRTGPLRSRFCSSPLVAHGG